MILAELDLTPAISLWLLIPGILLALVLSALLYREQRRMASLATVVVLTSLRLLLIALIALLLLQPSIKWVQQKNNAGTLWVVLDQSPSMQTTDPQALPSERLRWAEGLGLLSRENRVDFLQARTHVLMDEMTALTAENFLHAADERRAITAFADQIAQWEKQADTLQADIEKITTAPGVMDPIKAALSLVHSSVSLVRSAPSLPIAAKALDRVNISQFMGQTELALAAAADTADAAYRTDSAATVKPIDSRVAALSRSELAYGMLAGTDAQATKTLEDLAKHYRLRVASFADKVQNAGTVDPKDLSETIRTSLLPAGQSTNLAGALQGIAEQIAADEAASVVIVSDGRTNVAGDPSGTARNLVSRGVHVYGLLVGSHEVSPDAAVEPVDFPDWIYKGDSIRPRALIRLDGLAGRDAVVQLRRAGGNGNAGAGTVIDTRTVHITGNHETRPFDFTDTPPADEKSVEYEIRVSEMPGEVNTQNNIATFRVAIKKDKLYALIIEDRPRWEYRYLAAFLSRRQGMGLQTILLQPAIVAGIAAPSPTMAAPDNPHEDAQILPRTLDDWEKFDVIVLGDIGPETLTPQMQQYLAAAVRDKGATLITIAGQKNMPEKFKLSPLADILPVTLNPQWTEEQIDRHTRQGFRPYSSPLAAGSALAALDTDPGNNTRIWSVMPEWYWHSTYTEIKPAASAVWSLSDLRGNDGTIAEANRHALLSTMAIGLGHSLYLAADQSWRLRQVGGSNLHDRFWSQVLNWAVGSDLPAGGKYVRFGAGQSVYEQSQPVVITARILKDDLTPYTGLSFSALARSIRPSTQPAAPAAETGGSVEAHFEPTQSPGYYQATLAGLPNGDIEISLQGAEVERLLNTDPTVTLKTLLIKILPTMNAERRNMNTDPVMLETVARAGGGFSLDAQYADLLLSRLPKIEHVERTELQVGFFTDPHSSTTQAAHWSFLALFALIITVEWAIRKWAGLV